MAMSRSAGSAFSLENSSGSVSKRYWTLAPIAGTKGFLRNDQYAIALALVEEGAVTRDSTVFDNSVTRVGQLRSGEWERPVRDAWHGRALFRKAPR